MSKEGHFHDGTAWRKAKEIHAHDGTAWRKAKEAWAHDGTAWRQFWPAATTPTGFMELLVYRQSVMDSWYAYASLTITHIDSGGYGKPAWLTKNTHGTVERFPQYVGNNPQPDGPYSWPRWTPWTYALQGSLLTEGVIPGVTYPETANHGADDAIFRIEPGLLDNPTAFNVQGGVEVPAGAFAITSLYARTFAGINENYTAQPWFDLWVSTAIGARLVRIDESMMGFFGSSAISNYSIGWLRLLPNGYIEARWPNSSNTVII